MDYQISPAHASDHKIFSDIALAAKAYWGYPQAWLDLWKPDIVITSSMIALHDCWKIHTEDAIIGFTMVIKAEGEGFEIEHCWIKPEYIGKGYGGRLLRHVLEMDKYQQQPFGVLADPNAAVFYEKFGFKTIKQVPGKPEGRTLPWMEMVNP